MSQENSTDDLAPEEIELRKIYEHVFEGMSPAQIADLQNRMVYGIQATDYNMSEALNLPPMLVMNALFSLALSFGTRMCKLSDEEIMKIFSLQLKCAHKANEQMMRLMH